MPFNPGDLGDGPNWERAAASIIAARLAGEGSQAERQELEVRMTAQTILRRHLRISAEENERWADIDLDLNSATLVDFRFEGCRARDLRFTGAIFVGVARFFQSVCDGEADFAAAKFTSNAWFWRATFHDSTWFGGATFSKEAGFAEAKFDKKPMFGGRAWFGGCTFEGVVSFQDCKFTDGVELTNARVKLSVPQTVIDRRSWPSGWRVGNDTDSADSQWGRLAPDNE